MLSNISISRLTENRNKERRTPVMTIHLRKWPLICLSLMVAVLMFPFDGYAQERGEKIRECKVSYKPRVNYKLVSVGRTIREPIVTGLRIVLEPKDFKEEKLVQLTSLLKAKYCREQEISVVLFDDSTVAKEADVVVDELAGSRKVPELRGFYSFNRKTGKEEMSFSRIRGNPPDEVLLRLGN